MSTRDKLFPLLACSSPSAPRKCWIALVTFGIVACAAGCSSTDRQSNGSEALAQSEGSGAVVQERFMLIQSAEGLEPAHVNETPLLEKLAFIPAREHGNPPDCSAQRVYRDGTLYILRPRLSECGGTWHRLTSQTQEGVQQLEELFASLCRDPEFPQGDSNGALIYRVTSPRCTRQFVLRGIPSHAQSRLVQGTADIMNRTGIPIPADPPRAPAPPTQ